MLYCLAYYSQPGKIWSLANLLPGVVTRKERRDGINRSVKWPTGLADQSVWLNERSLLFSQRRRRYVRLAIVASQPTNPGNTIKNHSIGWWTWGLVM